MPFLNDAVPLPLSPEPAPPQPFHQLLGTAFTRENIVGSAIEAYQQPPSAPPDPSYDPFKDIGGYENDASAFISANNDEDVARVKMRINDERRREQELRDGGARGMVAALTAGILDPTILLPVGGQFYAATRAGRASLGAVRVGAAAGAATAVQETGLQLTQETRDLSESLINVGAATVLGGVLGGAIGALGRPLTREFADRAMREAGIFERELAGNAGDARPAEPGGSIGAAAVRDTTLEQETFAGALGAERALARTAPNTRVGTSPSLDVRKIGEDLVDQPLLTKKNAEGIVTPQSVETRMQLWEGPLATTLDDIEDAFIRYRLGRDPKMLDVARLAVGDLFGRSGGKMSYEEFAAEVTRAGRREDKSAIPEVAQAAAAARGKVIDPGKEKAIAAGLLDKDVSVSTAPSYMMRIYDTVKIVAKRGEFSARITGWLGREQTKKHAIRTQVSDLLDEYRALSKGADLAPNQPRLAAIQTELERLVGSWEGNTSKAAKSAIAQRTEKEATRGPDAGRLKGADKPVIKAAKAIAKANTQLDEGDLKDIARQIIDRILGTPVGRLPYDMEVPAPRARTDTAPPRGPLAARTFMIPDEEIEDFLENDIRRILHVYNRTMSADTELAVKFGRPDMEGQFQKVLQSYERLGEGVTDERKRKQLDAAKNSDMRDLAGMRDRLRGTYALPDNPDGFANRAFHVVRNLNYLRLLGGMTLGALSDIARAPMVHGMTNVFRDGLVPLLTDFRQYRMSAVEANLAGAANEMVLDTRAMSMADMLNDYGRWSKYERGIQAMTSKFGLVTLMAPWNQAIKQFVAVVSQTRSLRAIEALAGGGNVAQAERARLAHLGLGEEMIGRIASEFKTHGKKGRTWWANTAAWTDHEAADHFRGALVKEVDMVIVTPGQELPFWSTGAYGNTGKLIGQFKGFALSSAQRVMLSGLQKRDMATLNGAILMTGLGMVSYAIRQQLNSNSQPLPDPSTPEGLARWLREGVDRAGLTGWMFEAHNIVEKASGGNIGLGAITGGPPMSRYASRSAAESIAGPTFGTGFNLATQVFNAATTPGDWSAAETSAGRQMIPYQNVFYWRRLLDEAERGLNQALGVPDNRQ